MRRNRFAFHSVKFAPCVVNRWGVVFVPSGHRWADPCWVGFEFVPVEDRDLRRLVIAEAEAAGMTWDYRRRGEPQIVWRASA